MNAKRLQMTTLFVLAALLCSLGARGETTNLYAGPEFAPLDLTPVLKAGAAITLKAYPNCDEATVEDKMMRVYQPDGTAEAQDESFTKVLTEKGKRNNRTLTLSFMLPYTTVQVVKLEVIRPSGHVVPVDVAANSKESIDDSQMSMNIYDPNMRLLRVNIPSLDIGDMVHSVIRQTTERPIIPRSFSEESVFEGRGYIRHMSYEVHSPAELPLKRIALRAEIPGTVTYSTHAGPSGSVIHHWEIANVPRMYDEPSMPPYEMVLQRLFVSTIPNWQAVSKWYWDLSKPHLEATTPEMAQTIQELTASAKTDLDKVKALFYQVSKKVRYMGLTPEKDRPGFEPHDVKLTFNKKYGVCRDKAALLVALLRGAGLKAYPVLINVGTHKDPEVPDADFNHAIVSVELKPHQYILMDPTDENTRDLLPAGDCDQSFLVCRPEGEGLKLSSVEAPEKNQMDIVTTGTLGAGGRLEARSVLHCGGVNDDIFRNTLVHMKPDDQRRFFERNLKRALPGAVLTSFKLSPANMLDVSQPVEIELEYFVPDDIAAGDGKALVSLPWVGNQLAVFRYLLSGATLDKRKYPMQTWVTYDLKEALALKLEAGFGQALALPAGSPIDDDCLRYTQSSSLKDGALDCSREFELKVVEFTPPQYLRLKRTLKQLDYDARKAPLLADTGALAANTAASSQKLEPVDSNAEVLSDSKELDVKDAHSAVYRVRYSKKILTYAGKIREAELKVGFNPACEDAKLAHAVVIGKDGRRQEISKGEINVMDDGWNASAKRYTGGKILVANLPGVDIGSTIEVEFEVTSHNKPFLSGFEAFQLPDALDQKTFRLTAPAGLAVERLVTGPAGILTDDAKTAAGTQNFEWDAKDVKALPAESQLPPEWVYCSGVQYFVGDLKAYLKTLDETMLDRSRKSAKAAEMARKLADDAGGGLKAVRAIRDFVAKSIRQAGPSFTELPLSELSAADTTLADGYGHSADRAILLHAMLAAAGFKPEFVLASSLPPIAGITNVALSFPLPNSFSAPLVRVPVDGTTYYLNDSDQYAKLGSTIHDGQLGWVLNTQSSEVVHAAPDCDQKVETVYTMSLDPNGKTRLGVSRKFYGPNYNRLHRYFAELPPEEKNRYFQEVVSSIAQGAQPVSDLVTRFDTYPGLEQFAVEIDNYAVTDGKYLYFDLPFTPSLFPPGSDQRTLPLFVSGRSESRIRTEIELPSAFRHLVLAPKVETLEAPDGCGKAQVTIETSDGKYVIAHVLETAPAIVDPKQYAEVLNTEAELDKRAARLFLFQNEIIP
jgi:transglutaminase-like putative cysteine protease